MSKKKIELSPFQIKLKEFALVTDEILRTQPSEASAESLKIMTEKHAKLTGDLLNLNPVNQDLKNLQKIRDKFTAEERKNLNRTLAGLIASKNKKNEKINQEYERIANINSAAIEKINELAPLVLKAAKLYENATIQNMDLLYTSYKEQRNNLQAAINLLVDDKKRAHFLGQLSKLSEQVNIQQRKLIEQAAKVKQEIEAIVVEAEEIVNSMDVIELIQAIMPTATKNEILAIMNGKETEVLRLKYHAAPSGELVLANLPTNKQLSLIAIILGELSNLEADTEEKALTQKFIQAIVKDVNGLLSGNKTHLSMLAKTGNLVQVINVDIRSLLTDSAMLSTILYEFVRQGVTTESMVMTLSSVQEAAALGQLSNLNILAIEHQGSLSEITGKVMAAAVNPGVLKLITGHEVTEQALIIAGRNLSHYSPGKGFSPDQILGLLRKIVTLQIASTMVAEAFVNKKGALGQLGDSVKLGAIEGVSAEKLNVLIPPPSLSLGSSEPLLSIEHPKAETHDVENQQSAKPDSAKKIPNINDQKNSIMLLINELKLLKDDLGLRALTDNKYLPVSMQAAALHQYLEEQSSIFFQNPTQQTFDEFKKNCTEALNKAENVFNTHRGIWWDHSGFFGKLLFATKAILGLVAGFTFVPAVIISATTRHGYLNTFFTTPKTESATKLGEIKGKLEIHEEEIDEAFRAASPAA